MPFDFNKPEDRYLSFIALILFSMWILDIIVKLFAFKVLGWFWFCSFSLLLATLFIVYKKSDMILSFLSVSIVLQGIWIIDVLSLVFSGTSVFGTGHYLFAQNFSKAEIFTTMRHFFLIPLQLFAFIFIKKLPKRYDKVILYTFLFTLGFLLLSLPFGSKNNLNFVYTPPLNMNIILPAFLFFFVYLFFLIGSGSLVGYLIYFIFKKNQRLFNLKYLKVYFWMILMFLFLLSIKVTLTILKSRDYTPYINFLF